MTTEKLKKAPTIKSENYRELADPQWIAGIDRFFGPQSESRGQSTPGTVPAQRQRSGVERVLLATKFLAARLKNGQNQDLGKVEDLLLDMQDRVVFVILGRGGVAGIGAKYIQVPWSKLDLGSNQQNLAVTAMTDVSEVQLEKAPLITGDDYATLLAPGFAEQVHRYFKVTECGAVREQR